MRGDLDESAQTSPERGARGASWTPSPGLPLVVATLIHVVAGVWLLHARSGRAIDVADTIAEIEIGADAPEPSMSSDDQTGSVSPSNAARTTVRGNDAVFLRDRGTAAAGSSPEGDLGRVVLVDGDGLSRPFGSIHGGLGAPQADDGVSNPEAQPTLSDRGTKVLRDALYDRDKTIGLGAEGPVLLALASSAQASTAPVDGRAVFDVVVGSDGLVTSLTVSEGGFAWSGVARDAWGAVRGKKARVPASAKKGVAMKIEITSRVLLPSGHSPKTALTIGGIPLSKGDDKSIKVSVLDPIPKIVLVPLDPGGTVMVPMAYVEIFGTNVDPTDIGAQPRRVIASKVLDQHLL